MKKTTQAAAPAEVRESFKSQLRLHVESVVWSNTESLQRNWEDLGQLLGAAHDEGIFKPKEYKGTVNHVGLIRRHLLLGSRTQMLADVRLFLDDIGMPKEFAPYIKL